MCTVKLHGALRKATVNLTACGVGPGRVKISKTNKLGI